MSTGIDDVIWPAPDGSMWVYTASWAEWSGWEPGIDGLFTRTIDEFRAEYPDAPDWDKDEREVSEVPPQAQSGTTTSEQGEHLEPHDCNCPYHRQG